MDTKKTTFSIAHLTGAPSGKPVRPPALSVPPPAAHHAATAAAKTESERVKVFVRVRPTQSTETPGALRLAPGRLTLHRDGHACGDFAFDGVLGPSASQADVYAAAAAPAVSDVMQGYNATVFAYGQTGAGKTHTLFSMAPDAVGVIPRALGELLDAAAADSDTISTTVTLSYLQIYQEQLQDLLAPEAGHDLPIREGGPAGVHVPGLTAVAVSSLDECLRCLQLGARNRSVAFTALNAHSSRSHAVVVATVARRPLAGPSAGRVRTGKLFLVDLAGSERLKKSKSTGQRASEAKAINLSLTTLGMCVSARATGTRPPFRDSKLTRLLQESLGGNARTALVVAVADAVEHAEETLQSLQFGGRAMRVATAARVNEVAAEEEVSPAGPLSPGTSRSATLVASLLEKESQLEAVQAQLRAHQEQSRQVVEALRREHQAASAAHEAAAEAAAAAEARAVDAERRWAAQRDALEAEMISLKADALRAAAEAEAAHRLLEEEREAARAAAAAAEAARCEDSAAHAARLEELQRRWTEARQRLQEQHAADVAAAVEIEAERTKAAESRASAAEAAVAAAQAEAAAAREAAATQLTDAQARWEEEKKALMEQHDAKLAEYEEKASKAAAAAARAAEETAVVLRERDALQQQLQAASEEGAASRDSAAMELAAAQERWAQEKAALQAQAAAELAAAVAAEAEKTAAAQRECETLRKQLAAATAEGAAQRQAAAARLKEVEARWAAERQKSVEQAARLEQDLDEAAEAQEAEAASLRAAVAAAQADAAEARAAAAALERTLGERDRSVAELYTRVDDLKLRVVAAQEAAAAAEARAAASERARSRLVSSLQREATVHHAATVIQRAYRAHRLRQLERARSQGFSALSQAQRALGSLAAQHAELEARRHCNLALTGQTLVAESLDTLQSLVEGLVAEFLLPAKDLRAVQKLRAKTAAPDVRAMVNGGGGAVGAAGQQQQHLIGAFRSAAEPAAVPAVPAHCRRTSSAHSYY